MYYYRSILVCFIVQPRIAFKLIKVLRTSFRIDAVFLTLSKWNFYVLSAWDMIYFDVDYCELF